MMEKSRTPRPGDIYRHFKGNLYQIITVATHTETGESMVVYQALYGDFKTYVRPLLMFTSKTDKEKYPEATQEYRFELRSVTENNVSDLDMKEDEKRKDIDEVNETKVKVKEQTEVIEEAKEKDVKEKEVKEKEKEITNKSKEEDVLKDENSYENVNTLLLKFLDASSYTKKLEIITSNTKHLTDRIINDMAVSLDCTVEEGPLDQRIQGLIYCLQANRRFEDRRQR